MNLETRDLIKFSGHKLYVLDVVKHMFKKYAVC